MHILHVLTDKARRAGKKKYITQRGNWNLFCFVFCLLGMGLEWAAVRGWELCWPGDGEGRRNLRKINIIGTFVYKDANGILS